MRGTERILLWRCAEADRGEGAASRAERGYAMAITLLVLFLLGVALALVGMSLSIRLRMVRAETDSVVRGALADAALDEAVAHLAESSGYSGESRHELGDGEIESQVVQMGTDRYVVTATGTYAGRSRSIQAVVWRSTFGAVIESWRLVEGGEATRR